jgi:hypothetical protein
MDTPQSPADINGDGAVNILDLVILATACGSSPGHPRWDPRADVNYDDVVNMFDLVTFLLMAKDFDTSIDRSNIFFEYGAESGKLQPPWSECGVSPGATYSSHSDPSGVWVDDTHVRTGTKSMYCYQHAPPKDDGCRRITNRYYGSDMPNEYYFSWWVYFPSSSWNNEDNPESWGTTLGGIQLFWGPPTDRYKYHTALRFVVNPTGNRKFYLRYSWDRTTSGTYCGVYEDNYYWPNPPIELRSGLMDQWIHFQVYYKYRADGTGAVRGWINNVLIGETTNDPRAWADEWSSQSCAFAQGNGNPPLLPELYQAQDSPSHYIWVDDCVGAYKKVPEDYGVGYP